MNNKLDKFLISLSGAAMMILSVFGLKFQKDFQDMQNLKENLRNSLALADKVKNMIDLQRQIENARRENLKKVDNAQVGIKMQTKTQTVVIPGKTVIQTTAKTTRAS